MNYVFDLDDTIIDNSDLFIGPALRITREFLPWNSNISEAEDLQDLYADWHRDKTRELIEDGVIRLSPGVREFLEDRDFCAAGLTNSPPGSTEVKVRELELDRLLDRVVGPEEYGRKPDPSGLKAIIRESGREKESFVYVGDSVRDLLTGRRAGVRTALVTRDPFKRLVSGEDYRSFREFVEKHRSR
ncbi:MAG: HAD family hydrolase [Candidatus Nanohaloarchaea archaeon]